MIRMRAIETDDLNIMHRMRNHESVFPFVREYRWISREDQIDWFKAYRNQRRRADWDQELMIIEDWESDRGSKTNRVGQTIGVGGFVRIEWRNRKAEFSFYTITSNKEKAILEVLKKGFHDFNFHKITWPVYGHDPNLGIYRDIFSEEAVLKEEYFWEGKYHDRHYLSLTRKQFDKLSLVD